MNLFKRILCDVWTAVRHCTKDMNKELFSVKTWREIFGFLKEVLKDFPKAYKTFYCEVCRGEKRDSSPLKEGRLRNAGDSVFTLLTFRIYAVAVIGGALLGAALSLYVPVWILILLMAPMLLPLVYQMRNYALGYLGECAVGEELNNLLRSVESPSQWHFFHSFVIDESKKYDIDHIVVCPKGVFCLETKTWRYPGSSGEKVTLKNGAIYIGDKRDERPVKQARGNAFNLREFINEKIEEKISFVTPIIVYPGRTIVYPGRPADESGVQDDIFVRNHKGIGDVFRCLENPKTPPKAPLSPEQVEEIFAVLKKHNRGELTDAPDF